MSNKNSRGGNIFELYSGGGGKSRDDDVIDRRIYRAYDVEKTGTYKGEEEWLYIEFGPTTEPVHMVRYDHIQRIFAHGTNSVSLLLRDESFTFIGYKVDQLLLPIQDRRLRSIYQFQPYFHREPPDEDAKIIEIDRYTQEQFEREQQQQERVQQQSELN